MMTRLDYLTSLLVGLTLACSVSAQAYPRSSRLPRDEVKVNETFVNNSVQGYGGWRIAAPSERVPAGPAGTVPSANVCYMAYLDRDAAGAETLRFRRSTNGGYSWGAPQQLMTLQAGEVWSTGDMRILASEHDVFVVWSSNAHTLAAGQQAVFAIGSDDQGQSWTGATLLTPEFQTNLRDADEVNAAISRNGATACLNVVFEADTFTSGNEDIYFVQAEIQAGALSVTVPTQRLNTAWPAQQFDVDFTAIDADGPVIHIAWCDDRLGVTSDYFSLTSRVNGSDWASVTEYQHTILPASSWASPRRPQAAVDLPNVYTFMEHSLNGQDDVWMDWSTDLGISWLATGVAINKATLGAAGDIDGMLVTAQDQRVVVLYVDDRLNGTNNNANNQAVVAVSNNGGADFVAGTYTEVPLSLLDPNPIFDVFLAGDTVAAMYENNCGGGEGITVSLSSDGGQSFTHYDVTSFDGCGTFPGGVDVDNPRMCLTANGDCNILWQDDRTFAGNGGGNSVNNLWVTGIKYPQLIDNTATAQGVRFQDDSPAAAGRQCWLLFSLSSAPNTIAFDNVGTTLNIGYDALTQASVLIAAQTAANLGFVGSDGAVDFSQVPNVAQLIGLPVYAVAATLDSSGAAGGFTDPIRMQ